MEVQVDNKIKEEIQSLLDNNSLVGGEKIEAIQDILIDKGYKLLEIDAIIKNL